MHHVAQGAAAQVGQEGKNESESMGRRTGTSATMGHLPKARCRLSSVRERPEPQTQAPLPQALVDVLRLQQLLPLGAALADALAAGQVNQVQAAMGAGVGDLVGALHDDGEHLEGRWRGPRLGREGWAGMLWMGVQARGRHTGKL